MLLCIFVIDNWHKFRLNPQTFCLVRAVTQKLVLSWFNKWDLGSGRHGITWSPTASFSILSRKVHIASGHARPPNLCFRLVASFAEWHGKLMLAKQRNQTVKLVFYFIKAMAWHWNPCVQSTPLMTETNHFNFNLICQGTANHSIYSHL